MSVYQGESQLFPPLTALRGVETSKTLMACVMLCGSKAAKRAAKESSIRGLQGPWMPLGNSDWLMIEIRYNFYDRDYIYIYIYLSMYYFYVFFWKVMFSIMDKFCIFWLCVNML